ncbi:MAG: YidC/Oxa1 family membrane protein insertase [Clostridia bacterium]|nr:YidC/Oxa1 family membrane protein insertase [Clostridia bacterium]
MSDLILSSPLTAPHGLWVTIMNWIGQTIGNFGWTIVLFTILIKVAFSFMDFFIKWNSRLSTLAQQRCAPQLEKLKKKYSNNQQLLQTQTMAIYKKEG